MYLLWDSDAGYVRMTFACPRRQKMQHVWCSVGTYVSVIISILLAQQKTHVAQACTWDKPAFGTYSPPNMQESDLILRWFACP